MYLAPGASGSGAMHLPGAGAGAGEEWPSIEDHLVEAETRQEMVRGELIEALPSHPPHGDMHARLDRVVGFHVASGYVASTDLLTRYGPRSDFATDVCIRREGRDPKTGTRYLEEVCFEVLYTQSKAEMTRRAEDVIARGVRRLFGIFVKGIGTGYDAVLDESATEVKEWSPVQHGWVALARDAVLADACFARPLPVRAIVDAAAADDAVVRALRAKGNPVLDEVRAEGLRDGRAEGLRDTIRRMLARRGLALDEARLARLEACQDPAVLDRWFDRVLAGATPEELFAGE